LKLCLACLWVFQPLPPTGISCSLLPTTEGKTIMLKLVSVGMLCVALTTATQAQLDRESENSSTNHEVGGPDHRSLTQPIATA
jgi:hypothetical protein